MSTTRISDLPPHLQDRYGGSSSGKAMVALGILLAMFIIGIGVLTQWTLAKSDVYSKLLAWSAPTDTHTNITFEIRRNPKNTVKCVVRAQNKLHHDVGYATVVIPPGKDYVQQTYPLATTEKAYVGELLGCSETGEPNVQPPDFPPTAPNPPQPWSPNNDRS